MSRESSGAPKGPCWMKTSNSVCSDEKQTAPSAVSPQRAKRGPHFPVMNEWHLSLDLSEVCSEWFPAYTGSSGCRRVLFGTENRTLLGSVTAVPSVRSLSQILACDPALTSLPPFCFLRCVWCQFRGKCMCKLLKRKMTLRKGSSFYCIDC